MPRRRYHATLLPIPLPIEDSKSTSTSHVKTRSGSKVRGEEGGTMTRTAWGSGNRMYPAPG